MWLYFALSFCIVLVGRCSELISYQEAAFQGRCDHGSACDQLCYELHDGMYECACTYGYQLNTNGYSCQEINSTYQPNENLNSNSEEDVLYQRGASFSAELDVNNNTILSDSKKENQQSSEIINKETQVVDDDHIDNDYDDTKDDREQVNSRTTTSAQSIKTTIATHSSSHLTTTTNTFTPTLTPSTTSSIRIIATSANDNLFINKTKKNNQNNFHVKNDFILSIDSSEPLKDSQVNDDTAKTYYQYFTDDSYRTKIDVPHFSEKSWMAFPVLRGAYKYVQLQFEFKPEKLNGVILLTGERDDLTGDFIAVLMNNGFIEFWFDCGSGIGKVVSAESAVLNQWNTLIVYRYRWDAWILLNQGKRVQGRSKGLFSRITFREPIFLGGTGNITGIDKKISVADGFVGCIRKFNANEQDYIFTLAPFGNATQIFDVHECQSDECSKSPLKIGKKCLPNDQDTIPSFNGSSYLSYSPLEEKTLIWFELKMVLKAKDENGILLYSGHDERGDFISLSLVMGYVEFMFDLGSGTAVVRNTFRLSLNEWHKIHVSRTARLAVLKIDDHAEVMTISPKGFWHLTLPHNLYLGGVPQEQYLSDDLKGRGLFKGCVQKVEINGRSISIMSEAIGGSNVDDCTHACSARPCGTLARCIPKLDNYECICNQFNNKCKQELLSNSLATQLPEISDAVKTTKTSQTTTTTTATSTTTTEKPNEQPTISIIIDSKIDISLDEKQEPKPKPPSLVNNEIEVSVIIPTIDTIEEGYIHPNVYNTYSNHVSTIDVLKKKTQHSKHNVNRKRSQLKHKSKYSKRRNGVCFSGDESYFHFHDEETKRHIINYNVDINLRMKTYSSNGLILWAGPHTGSGDYLMIGIENGDSQEGSLEIDGGKPIKMTSPGELRKLNADTVLYVGGMPDVMHYTKRNYLFGIVGCISEIVLGGELKLDLNTETNAKARNHHFSSGLYL